MKVKCPICGAPLENESCSYCGFVIEHSTTTEIDVLHDLYCQIMILPYSHSLSIKSVARNGYGYIRTMQRWNSCGL